MVGNGVQAAGAFEQGEVMGDEARGKEDGADAASPFTASGQISNVAGKAAHIRRKCKQKKEMGHGTGSSRRRAAGPAAALEHSYESIA